MSKVGLIRNYSWRERNNNIAAGSVLLACVAATAINAKTRQPYSHSIVAGGLLEMS